MELAKREEPEREPERYAIRWPLFLEAGGHRYRVISCSDDPTNGTWLEWGEEKGDTELCRHPSDGVPVEHPAMSLAEAIQREILGLNNEDTWCLLIPLTEILAVLIEAGEPTSPASPEARNGAGNPAGRGEEIGGPQ